MTMTMADVSVDDGVVSSRVDRPRRRKFTVEYKLKVLAEYEASWALRQCSTWEDYRPSGRSRAPFSPRSADAGALQGLAAGPRWTLWEKRTRSWSCSPRARTPRSGRSGDRPRGHRPGGALVDDGGV